MTKIALITDLHFGARNANQFIYENQKKFFYEIFFPYLENNKIKTIINLGDTFDNRKHINTEILHKVRKDIFDKMNDYDCHFLVGNHDAHFKNSNSVNSITECLADYDNIKIYDIAQEITIDDCKIFVVPWLTKDNIDNFNEQIMKTSARICVGHLELTGYEFHRGSVCKNGMNKKVFLDHFEKVFSGHFHKKSVDNKLTYLGTSYQLSWIDYNERKGFHVYDTETNELTFIENPNELFVQLEYPTSLLGSSRDKYIKIIVSEEQSKSQDFQDYLNVINGDSPISVDVSLKEIISNNSDSVTVDNINVLSLLEVSKDYIYSIENFTKKDKLMEEFENLYREAIC